MSTKAQTLKRRQKGEVQDIENQTVDKKIFKDNKVEIVKGKKPDQKNQKGKKDFKNKGGQKKDGKQVKKFDKKQSGKNKKLNQQLLGEENKNNENDDTVFEGNITLAQISSQAEKLWSKNQTESQKQDVITKLLQKVQSIIGKLVQKRQGSRAIQACIKYGTEAQQNQVFQYVLKQNFSETVKSKYGHFLALRMVKAMKKNDVKAQFFQVLLKNAFYLVSHVEGAKVIDQYLRHLAKPSELNSMKKVFDQVVEKTANKNSQEKFEGIDNLAVKIVDKSNHYPLISKYILQISLPHLIPAERQKIIEYLREKILDLIEDKEGIKLCLDLINYAQAKDRKVIIKNVKDNVAKIIQAESSSAFLVIQKLIHSVDDTVILEKQILKPIKTDFNNLIKTKNGFSIISSIFIPQHNAVKTIEKEIKFTTSKKDESTRLKQLQGIMIKETAEYLKSEDRQALYKNFGSSRFISAVLKYILKEQKNEYFDLVKSVLEDFSDESLLSDKKFTEESLFNHIDSHRILKNILTVSSELQGEAQEIIYEYIEKLNQLVINNISLFAKNRSSIYIVISLIEQTSFKDVVIQAAKNVKFGNLDKKEPKDLVGINILKKYL